jgi:hypothetical protein
MKKSCSVLMLFAAAVSPVFASVQDTLGNMDGYKSVVHPQVVVDEEPEEFPILPVNVPAHDSVLTVKVVPKDTVVAVPDTNYLLLYINSYDVSKHLVRPKPPRVFKPKEVLDYPTRMSPLFMPLVFNSQRRSYHLDSKDLPSLEADLKAKSMDSLRAVFQSNRYIRRLAQNVLQNAEIEQIGQIDEAVDLAGIVRPMPEDDLGQARMSGKAKAPARLTGVAVIPDLDLGGHAAPLNV